MEDIVKRIAKLSPAQRDILIRRSRQGTYDSARGLQLRRRLSDVIVPLSCLQEQLWVHEQLSPGGAAYHIRLAYRVQGLLNDKVLERALQAVLRRHEALRAYFPSVEGAPVQKFATQVTVQVQAELLPPVNATDVEATAQLLLSERLSPPFDLAHGPLYRFVLLRVTESDHFLAFAFHHLIVDGWSCEIFLKELSAAYAAALDGVEPKFPNLAIQYGDFALCQREWLLTEGFKKQLSFWTDRLQGLPQRLDMLPSNTPRHAISSDEGRLESGMLPAEVSAGVRTLAAQAGVSLFTLLMTAFAILLYRYSGQSDILLGTPVAGRTRDEVQNLIGLFANTLVFRVDLTGTPTFRTLLHRVKQLSFDAISNQDVPLEQITNALPKAKNATPAPLFQFMFDVQSPTSSSLELQGLKCAMFGVERKTAAFDLHLTVIDATPAMKIRTYYRPEVFQATTVTRFLECYSNLVADIVRNPDMPVTDLELDAGHRGLVTGYTVDGMEPVGSVLSQFRAQASLHPDKEALILGLDEDRLTYHELDQRSDELAALLQSLGVCTETSVGVTVSRSLSMIVALLATLKAGGAVVPLDPASPPERLFFMSQDAGISVLIEDGVEELPWLASLPGCSVLRLGSRHVANGSSTQTPRLQEPAPEQAAYIVYTSGSTGNPKGVIIPHGAIAMHSAQIRQHFDILANDRVLQFASMSFDVFMEQVFATLTSGATLIVRGPETPASAELLRLIRTQHINIVNLPTAYWAQVARDWAEADVIPDDPLKVMIVGGEAMRPEAVAAWQRTIFRGIRLLNVYGPTEATISATSFEVRGENAPRVPIGKPIGSRQIYILDSRGRPVPTGVVGELCIAGPLLARGYLGHSVLTAEKFLPDPFSQQPGSRLYRTGDQARLGEGNAIEFMGRTDHQVKVRGFRIELGEIEVALNRHPEVAASVVVAREHAEGHTQLAAFIEKLPSYTLTPERMRAFAEERLPAHMVPAHFVVLEKLPYNVNGKLDYRALPDPVEVIASEEPRTASERTLCGVWAEVLRVPKVGIHDNFFELGGDSIMAIHIIARAAKAGVRISARQLYQHPTVAALARISESSPAPERIAAGSLHDDVWLTPTQRFFLGEDPIDPDYFNQSLLFEVPAGTSTELLRSAFRAVLEQHDALRKRFVRTPLGWKQITRATGEACCLGHVDLSDVGAEQQNEEIKKIALRTQEGLSLESGPLLRVVQFDLGGNRSGRLLIVIHHLVVDAVSWNFLIEDLLQACGQIAAGAPVHLGEKATSFDVWAHRLCELARSGEVLRELEFWEDQIPARVSPLPVDHCKGANLVEREVIIRESLSQQQTAAYLEALALCPRLRADAPLLAALVRTICAWCDSDELLVTLEGHGREPIIDGLDISRTVGWFTAIFPLRFPCHPSDRSRNTLQRVSQLLAKVPNGGGGYGLLRHSGMPQAKRLVDSAKPQVCFNYLGRFEPGYSEGSFLKCLGTVGLARSPRAYSRYSFAVSAAIVRDRLQVEWMYNTGSYRGQTASDLLAHFFEELQLQINACRSQELRFGSHLSGIDLPERELAKAMRFIGKR
jgi:amino acid adenylation domain-containing protein/non-ribosomal peptide synthase protein (TIGR01720 family)